MSIILQALETLPAITAVTFITGNDLPRQKRLEKIAVHHKNYTVLGFTNQVATLMKDTDLLITKPGGLTISEALATATPILIFSPIPGIEEANARFLEKEHLGFWAQNGSQLQDYLAAFIKAPQLLTALSENMLMQKSFQASNKILDHVTSAVEKVAL